MGCKVLVEGGFGGGGGGWFEWTGESHLSQRTHCDCRRRIVVGARHEQKRSAQGNSPGRLWSAGTLGCPWGLWGTFVVAVGASWPQWMQPLKGRGNSAPSPRSVGCQAAHWMKEHLQSERPSSISFPALPFSAAFLSLFFSASTARLQAAGPPNCSHSIMPHASTSASEYDSILSLQTPHRFHQGTCEWSTFHVEALLETRQSTVLWEQDQIQR